MPHADVARRAQARAAQPPPPPYAFVTVAHADDEYLLRLQARSMRVHLVPALAAEIVIVENFGTGRRARWREALLAEYGHLAARVRFVPSGALGPMPPDAPGWWTQQALKLLACRAVGTDRCVVMDAKNHLIAPLDRDFLEAPDGRMLARRHCYRDHPLRCFLERTLAFCDLPAEPTLGCFMQTDTPFCLRREDAAGAIAFVESRTAGPFAAGLIGSRITEFFLLAAILTRQRLLDARYAFAQTARPAIWDGAATLEGLLSLVRAAAPCPTPVFSVHRRALLQLDGIAGAALGRFWFGCGLFESPAAAAQHLSAAAAQPRLASVGEPAPDADPEPAIP